MPWSDYAADLEWHFNPQVATPEGRAPAMAERAALSAAARATLQAQRDIAYGPSPRQLLDFYPADGGTGIVHIYVHGGYWRRGHKDSASYAALPSVRLGLPTVVMTYDLCPAVSLEQLVAQVLDGVEWVYRNARGLGTDARRVFLSGHSAGAHLCAMALACDWAARGLPPDCIAGAALVSGIYDLGAVPSVSVNADIRLDAGRVAANSPMFMPPRAPIPVLLAVGGRESAGWIDQTMAYADVCRSAGCATSVIDFPGDNHYSMAAAAHGREDSPVMKAIAALVR